MPRFPNPRTVRSDVIAFGDDLRVETLREAYRSGIFPWPHDDYPLPWFSPRRRTLLFFDELHAGRTLRKAMKRDVTFTIDRDFRAVIHACANAPRHGEGTWIGQPIVDAYIRFHESRDAHSVEVWDGERLIGGLYGIDCGGAFTGESMFYVEPNASKLALLFLIDHLRARGVTWIDCQVMTPHMAALGARDVRRSEFLDRLAAAQAGGIRIF